MKKLIITAAIVCVAAVSQAAAVAWSLTGVSDSPANSAAAGWVAYFMDGSTYSTFSGTAADQIGAYCAANYTYTATTAAGRTGVQASATSGTYSGGDEVSAYIVLFDAADATAAKYYAATAVDTKTVPSSGNLSWSKTMAQTSGWTTTAVPEPTSGLLLLLGMAGLALKRKHA